MVEDILVLTDFPCEGMPAALRRVIALLWRKHLQLKIVDSA